MTDRPRLAIDTDAEALLRAGGELEGPWQIPSELVRGAFRSGARRVTVSCHRSGFTVRNDGAALDAGTCALLDRALDHRNAGGEAALAALEAGGNAELRFLASLPRASVAVTAAGSAVAVSGLRWSPDRARDWLASVGRFAGPAIELDGTPVGVYVPGHVASVPLASPWPGHLWLRDSGDDGVLWLLRNSVVAAYLVLPGSLPFEATLDLSGAGAPSAAALRDRVAPLVPMLVDVAARLTCEKAAGVATCDAHAARRLRVLLMSVARLPRWRSQALRAAAFPARLGGKDLWLSLADLGAPSAKGPDRRIATCEPTDLSRSLVLSEHPAVVLEARERARLSQELGLRFSLLPLAEGASGQRSRGLLEPIRARLRRFTRTGVLRG